MGTGKSVFIVFTSTDDGKVSGECFIDTDTDWITAVCWPTTRQNMEDGESCLVGCVNGIVSLITVQHTMFSKLELFLTSQPNGKKYYLFYIHG